MKDRTLESVSKGAEYSGTEAGYKIEMQEQGFVLLDASGNPALDGGNGRGPGRGQDLPSGGRRDQISQSGAAKEQGRDILHRRCRNGPENILEGRSRNQGGLCVRRDLWQTASV